MRSKYSFLLDVSISDGEKANELEVFLTAWQQKTSASRFLRAVFYFLNDLFRSASIKITVHQNTFDSEKIYSCGIQIVISARLHAYAMMLIPHVYASSVPGHT